jgi:PKD repeat protein
MKRLLILCILLLCIVPLASATNTVNTSLATIEDPWYYQQNITTNGNVSSPGDVCSAYGLTDAGSSFQWWADGRSPYTPAGMVSLSQFDSAVLVPTTQTYFDVPFIGGEAARTMAPFVKCSDGNFYTSQLHPYYNSSAYIPAPISNFMAAPLNATAPAYVAFTDTSQYEYGTCTYNWSFTPSDGIIGSPGFLEQESPTVYFTEVGDYTVSHGVSCDAGSNISTKTDYIHILNSTGAITTCFAAIDALSGYQLSGANFQMYDIQNTTWTNKTASSTGSECLTTMAGNTINTYTDMLGYDDGELLASTARASPDYPILMFPANATNVSAGNLTLYVTVRDMYSPGLPISGAQVDMTYNFPSTEQKTTGASGMVSFVVPNQTTIYLAAQKSGYSGKSVSTDSGNGNGGDASVSITIYLPQLTVTTATTVTTLPGGGTPAPTVTYLANCNPSAPDYDAAKCRTSKGGMGLNILADNLENLIWLVLIVTMIYLLKGIGK